jgi:hypothetical protein
MIYLDLGLLVVHVLNGIMFRKNKEYKWSNFSWFFRRMATCYAFTTFSRNSPMNTDVNAMLVVLTIFVVYFATKVIVFWWENRNDKNP